MAPPTESNAVVDHASLLCTEDACGCFFDDDTSEDASGKCEKNDDDDYYGLETTMFVEEERAPSELELALHDLFEREKQYMPQAAFIQRMQHSEGIDASSRKKAVSWLLKMREFFKFTPYTASLSVNYFDRFLSLHHLPSGKAWTLQLLSVACLSLAVKMEEIEAPVLLDLQVGADLMFEPRTIQRMELLVLSTLGWRMSSVTPISYTNYFINRLDLAINFKRVLMSRVNELILLSTLGGVLLLVAISLCLHHDRDFCLPLCQKKSRFVLFSPSSVAAAAMLCAVQETLPRQAAEQRRYLLFALPQQSQVELGSCFALMAELFSTAQCSTMKDAENSVPQSPVAVLDASFSSNSLSNNTLNCHSCPPISSPSPPKKRRVDSSS